MSLRLRAGAATLGLLALTACSGADPDAAPTPSGAATQPAATSTPGASPSVMPSTSAPSAKPSVTTPVPTVTEPTTTNTLPPPPRPSRPAPSTAGALSASSLPVPAGWKTVVRPGGVEEGFEGNGTWVHAKDPRYAAYGVITLGCAEITRDDYPDPTAALEGNYAKKQGDAGIGLALQFASDKKAASFWNAYQRQVAACTKGGGPVQTRRIASAAGLIDQRTYPDGDWTEVGARAGSRVTLILLTDPGHRITRASSEALLSKITS